MKVAIVHEWLQVFAGAERVLEQLLACYPEADLYATVDFMPEAERGFLDGRKVRTSFIQRLPFAPLRLTRMVEHAVYIEKNGFFRVLPWHADQRLYCADFDAEFLAQLAAQGSMWRFTGLDLASGEFPGTGQMPAGGSLRDENASAGIVQNAGGNVDRIPHAVLQERPHPAIAALPRLQGRDQRQAPFASSS